MLLEEIAALPAGILHAPVGVVHQPARRVPACHRHAQRVERHRTQSNFKITTNLLLDTPVIPQVTNAYD